MFGCALGWKPWAHPQFCVSHAGLYPKHFSFLKKKCFLAICWNPSPRDTRPSRSAPGRCRGALRAVPECAACLPESCRALQERSGALLERPGSRGEGFLKMPEMDGGIQREPRRTGDELKVLQLGRRRRPRALLSAPGAAILAGRRISENAENVVISPVFNK